MLPPTVYYLESLELELQSGEVVNEPRTGGRRMDRLVLGGRTVDDQMDGQTDGRATRQMNDNLDGRTANG